MGGRRARAIPERQGRDVVTKIKASMVDADVATQAELDAKVPNAGEVTATMLASTLDLSAKTVTMPASSVTGAMLSGGGWTYGSQVATTSGTTAELSAAVPAWATEIEVLLSGVSTNTANQPPMIQVGDSGGYDVTGYTCVTSIISSTSANEGSHTDGFETAAPVSYAAAEAMTGVLRLCRWDTAEHLWMATGQFVSGSVYWGGLAGSITPSAALDRVRLTTTSGAATFDAGEARIRYR